MSNSQRGSSARPVAILIAAQMRTPGGKPSGGVDLGKSLRKVMNSSPLGKSPLSTSASPLGTVKKTLQSLSGKPDGGLSKSTTKPQGAPVDIHANVKLGQKAQEHADAIRDTMSQQKPNLLSALGHGMKLANELKRHPPEPLSEMPKHGGGASDVKRDGKTGDDARFKLTSNVKLEGKAQDHAESMRTAMTQKKPDLLSALKHGIQLAHEMKRNPPKPLSEMSSASSSDGESHDNGRFKIISSHTLEGESKTHADALRDAMSQKQPDMKAILAHGVRLAQSLKDSRGRLSPMQTGTHTANGQDRKTLSEWPQSTKDRDDAPSGQGE